MRAAVYRGPQKFVIEDIPIRDLEPDEVLVKIKYSGICGTDIHAYQYDLISVGHVPGHEYSGVVERIGSSVKLLEKGDRVTGGGGTPPIGLTTIPRKLNQFNFRDQGVYNDIHRTRGFAEYTILKEWEPLKVSREISDLQAAMIEPCSTAVRAVRSSSLKLGDNVLIMGAGHIGMLCLQAVRAAGASKIVVSEPSPARRQSALALGADVVIDALDPNVDQAIISTMDGIGPDVIFECAAAPATLDLAFDVVRNKGSIMLVALSWEGVPLIPIKWVTKEPTMAVTYAGDSKDWEIAASLIAEDKIDLTEILSDTEFIDIDDIQSAFQKALKPGGFQAILKLD
jgi:L-iditol 2-dehydrogenase